MLCMEELDDNNYLEYKIHDEQKWQPAGFCVDCVEQLISEQWTNFTQLVAKETCRAALLRLCASCPLNVKDWIAMPCSDHSKPQGHKDKAAPKADKPPCPTSGEVAKLWRCKDGTLMKTQLKGAKVGKERNAYIAHLKEFAMLLEDTEAE